jgi:hypothetical protein
VGPERGRLSLVTTSEELLGRNSSGFSLENRNYDRRESRCLHDTPLFAKVGTDFTDKRRSLGQYSSLVDKAHVVFYGPPRHVTGRVLSYVISFKTVELCFSFSSDRTHQPSRGLLESYEQKRYYHGCGPENRIAVAVWLAVTGRMK